MNLVSQVQKDVNTTVRYGTEAIDIKNLQNGVEVKTKEEETLFFDLVIVANGSGSLLRNCFPKNVIKSEVQNYAALWTTLPYNGEKHASMISHVYHKSRYTYGLMPIGFNNNEHSGKSQINFFCAITKEYFDDWGPDKFESWKKLSYEIAPQYSAFIDQITDYSQLVATPYYDARLKKSYQDKVVFIGDSCHALSPHLSAGINLALMDVYELFLALKEEKNYQLAYERYFKARKKQIAYYYNISKVITPLFQSATNLSWIRDNVIPVLYKIPFTKRIMVETISGIRKNVFKNIDKEFYV